MTVSLSAVSFICGDALRHPAEASVRQMDKMSFAGSFIIVHSISPNHSKPARAAHSAVVAGLAAWLQLALLLFLEEVNQLRNGCLFHAESLFARMRRRNIHAAQPGRAHTIRCWGCVRLSLRIFLLKATRGIFSLRNIT